MSGSSEINPSNTVPNTDADESIDMEPSTSADKRHDNGKHSF